MSLELLEKAKSRNHLIPDLLANKSNISQSKPVVTAVVRLITKSLFPSPKLIGQSNVDAAIELSKDNPLIIIANHQSDADTTAKRWILEHYGYRDLANRMVYPAGLKMYERAATRVFIKAETVAYVATPYDLQDINHWQNHPDLSNEDQQTLADYEANCNKLNRSSLRGLTQLSKSGHVVSLYPEATRSRDGLIMRAPAETVAYFRKDSYVLPVVLTGPAENFPPNRRPTWRPTQLTMRVGRPFATADILEDFMNLKYPTGINKIDLFMAQMAKLSPESVRPEDRKFYQYVLTQV